MSTSPRYLRYVSTNRRVREDRRFVAGMGQFVADVRAANMLHVALVPSPHPAARIVSIDAQCRAGDARRALRADRRRTCRRHRSPDERPRYAEGAALSARGGQARYAGEWVAAVVAETRALAEDARRKGRGRLRTAAVRDRCRGGVRSRPSAGARGARLQRAARQAPSSGARSTSDFAESQRHLSFRVVWGRSSTVPIETFGMAATWDPWRECSTSGPRSRCRNIPTRSHARCGCPPIRQRASGCRCRRQLRRQARHQADRAGAPIWRAASAARCG